MFQLKYPLQDMSPFEGGAGGSSTKEYKQEIADIINSGYQSYKDCYSEDYEMTIKLTRRVGTSNWEYDRIVHEYEKRRDWRYNSPYPGVQFEFEKDSIWHNGGIAAKVFETKLTGPRSAVKNALIQMGENTDSDFEYEFPHMVHKKNQVKTQRLQRDFDGSDKEFELKYFLEKVEAINKFVPEATVKLEVKVGPDSKRCKMFPKLDFPYRYMVIIEAPELLLKTINPFLDLD